MNEQEAISRMIPPGQPREGKWLKGVIQIRIIRGCDLKCFGCTQASQIAGPMEQMSLEHFEWAVKSIKGYFGVVGVFGGNPALHKEFPAICEILARHVPKRQRGIWCNHPRGHGALMRETFNANYSNLNVHGVQEAYDEFKRDWPESKPVGLGKSRHSPVHGSMVDLGVDEGERWQRISDCDINQHWSAIIASYGQDVFGYVCEIMASQSWLRRNDPTFVHMGMPLTDGWWQKPIQDFADQIRNHCHNCLVPMRGHGEIDTAGDEGIEQTTKLYELGFTPKAKTRQIQIVASPQQLQADHLRSTVDYIGNSKR